MLDREGLPTPEDFPVLVVSAPGGFGKSQLLAKWCTELQGRKLSYIACSRLGESASSLLELFYTSLGHKDSYKKDDSWREQADSLLELLYSDGPSLLVLDDIHHLESETSQVDECSLLLSYLLDYRPENCHWVFCGRNRPRLADFELKKMSGLIKTLTAKDLSLNSDQLEILSPGMGGTLFALTSGWPLACNILLKSEPETWQAQKEVLSQNLLRLAIQELSAESREAVAILGLLGTAHKHDLDKENLWQTLEPISEQSALVQKVGRDKLQVHPLFAEQYREEAPVELRERAIQILCEQDRAWEALELYTDDRRLADQLVKTGGDLLRSGRFRLLETLLQRAKSGPKIAILEGRLKWFQGDPAQALEKFQQAALESVSQGDNVTASQSWQAAGKLYIDAVCPKEAQTYLKKAYRVLGPGDGQQKATVLSLLAENAVNVGQVKSAKRYRKLAKDWDENQAEDLALTSRLMLRSGRLAEARGAVLVALKQRGGSPEVLDGHRDPRLVLSYLAAMEGNQKQALDLAQEVLDLASQRGDARTESVALTRLAHAKLLQSLNESQKDGEALELYSQAENLAKTLGVERLRAEPLMGQALFHISRGNIPRAYEAAREGVELSKSSGDSWLTAWLEFVQAMAALTGGHPSAADLMAAARADFEKCRDRFGAGLAKLWVEMGKEEAEVSNKLNRFLTDFPFLGERSNLFGPPPQSVSQWLEKSAGGESKRLQVFCLGPLSLLRDGQAVPSKAFKRKKARELFVLLLASPDTFFHREELAAILWPKATQKAALRDFRVALHALSDALEPNRAKNTTAFCIERQEERYRLISAKLDLDCSRFESLTESTVVDPKAWEKAVRLYRGPFCEDYPYLEATDAVRRRYDEMFLNTASKLAAAYLEEGKASAASELAQSMLRRDPTWEPAYRILMKSQHASGHEHLLPRTFTRCLETLEQELGVEPSDETFDLARDLLGEQLTTLL